MLTNAFIGKPKPPTDGDLATALGPAKKLWDRLLQQLADDLKLTTHEWNSYSKKAGWALRIKDGDRNIVYLSPSKGAFMASFALGDKAVKAALAAKLPAEVVKIIKEGKRYAEGTAVRLEVKSEDNIVP